MRYLLGGKGVKGFGGRPNSIENIIKNRNELNEGVWSAGTPQQIANFIRDVEDIKDEYYNIVGSDAVFNGLDEAIIEAEKLMDTTPLKESKVLFKLKK